jgi:hypothetical protein
MNAIAAPTGDNWLPVLAADIKAAVADARRHASQSVAAAIRVGEYLIEAKRLVKHGEWLPWLTVHVDISDRMARHYMRLAKHKEMINPKSETVPDLTLRGAIAELTESRTDLPARLPTANTVKIGIQSSAAGWHEIWVAPSAIFTGFFYVTGIRTLRGGGGSLVGTRKPICLGFVDELIQSHCLTEAHCDVTDLQWTEHQFQPWSYNFFTETGVGDFIDELDLQEVGALARRHMGGLKSDDIPHHYRHEIRHGTGEVRPVVEMVFGSATNAAQSDVEARP